MKKNNVIFFLGILGLIETYDFDIILNQADNEILDTSSNSLFHGITWVYVYSTDLLAFDINLWYQAFSNNILDESFNFFFFIFWVNSLFSSVEQLFFAITLDFFTNSALFKYPFNDSWTDLFYYIYGNGFLIFYPELIFLKSYTLTYFEEIYSNARFVFYNLSEHESLFINFNLSLQYLILIGFSTLFLILYFSFYTNPFKEENFIDSDYLNASALVEAEKEISSLDDMVLVLIVLMYIFGWYFYVHCWSLFSYTPELTLVFYLLPGLYFIIIGIPTFLMWDFGIFFLVYLRGIGKSASLSIELMYDYLAVIIFYTRILVQGIRLVLMLFTYLSMQEMVLFLTFGQSIFLGYEFFWENLNYLSVSLDTFSYYLIFSFFGTFLYWIYEILHTYFVVTVQFIAFFAIVFWLFLFLYTFFVIEKQENYFTEKRKLRKQHFSYLY